MNYFAYGSNMSLSRLRERVPGAERLGHCFLGGHQLRFHKSGKDGSAKCDAWFTGRESDYIHGALFHIDPLEKNVLDAAEGLGLGYAQKNVQLLNPEQEIIEAFTYYATSINDSLRPYSWYLHHVLVGARESGLPVAYVSGIESVTSTQDPDSRRDSRERAIHL